MSIHQTRQTGDIDEPLPQSLLELQQIALGFFLIWDSLDKHYSTETQKSVELTALLCWAAKHKVTRNQAIEALIETKGRFIGEPFAHYIHCRDFNNEGWANMLAFNPLSNQDVIDQIKSVLDSRPFKGGPQ